MMLRIFVFLVVVLGCRTKMLPKSTHSQKDNYKLSIVQAQKNRLSLTQEFTNFKSAISDYKNSTHYKYPQNESDKELKYLVDSADLLTQEDVKQMITNKKFSKLHKTIKTSLPEITAVAHKALKVKRKPLQLTSNDEE